ncbi:MAG: hypothetical protein BGN88_15455 [Clostridiales bacterium 43-6]|nr:MAG: hypothetical protein BGN88_15455 [Clostridiales bacterium 43-6]
MKNRLLKLMTKNQDIRFYYADVTDISKESCFPEMKTDAAKELYQKIFTICCLMRGFLEQEDQRIKIFVQYERKECYVNCNIDGEGRVHCLFSEELASFDGDISSLTGTGAYLSLTKISRMEGKVTGTIALSSHSFEQCLSDYYRQSEQTETIFIVYVNSGRVQGCMIQPLPFALREAVKAVENSVAFYRETIGEALLSFCDVVEEYTLSTDCKCRKEMFAGALLSLETEELRKSAENSGEELVCGICGKKYLFTAKEIETIIKVKEQYE